MQKFKTLPRLLKPKQQIMPVEASTSSLLSKGFIREGELMSVRMIDWRRRGLKESEGTLPVFLWACAGGKCSAIPIHSPEYF